MRNSAGFDDRLPRIVIITAAKIEHRPHNASRWRAALKLTDPLKFEVIAKPQTKKARHLARLLEFGLFSA
ncbi:MAG: hypothetical protein WCD62_25100, partial [Pseudolabrys sp.]